MTKLPLLAALTVLAGCASGRLITDKNAMNSRIEIDYVLGHSRYKYTAIGGAETARVSSSRDEHVLEDKSIPVARYRDFAARLEKAIRSAPAGVVDESCRTPYRVRIVIEGRESTTAGCRSADAEGQIGQLLKEGEFLFYAAKPESESEAAESPGGEE